MKSDDERKLEPRLGYKKDPEKNVIEKKWLGLGGGNVTKARRASAIGNKTRSGDGVQA